MNAAQRPPDWRWWLALPWLWWLVVAEEALRFLERRLR